MYQGIDQGSEQQTGDHQPQQETRQGLGERDRMENQPFEDVPRI